MVWDCTEAIDQKNLITGSWWKKVNRRQKQNKQNKKHQPISISGPETATIMGKTTKKLTPHDDIQKITKCSKITSTYKG